MRRLETASDLRAAWKTIAARLARDFSAMHRLATDPRGALQSLGYEVGPEAAKVLASALP
ncbi:MAG: hypothetical protein QF464_14520 [Myxococcota bacterium]|nr:hypothetical protein [Myxococcota bacterium]